MTNNKNYARVKLRESICSHFMRDKGVKKDTVYVVEGMQYLANSTPLNSLKMSSIYEKSYLSAHFFSVIWGD